MNLIFEKRLKDNYDFTGLKEDLKSKLEKDGYAVFFKTVAVEYDALKKQLYVFHDYEIFDSIEEVTSFIKLYYECLHGTWLITNIEANVLNDGDICIVADNVIKRREQVFSIQTIGAL